MCVYICKCVCVVGSCRAEHWAHTAAGVSCRKVKTAGTENSCNTEHKLLLCCLLKRCTGLSCWLYIWEQIIWPAVELEASWDTWWYPIRLVTAASARSTRGTRAAGTQCQDADEVLLLNECLITNDPGLCYQVPWAVLPWESHLSGACKVSGVWWDFVFCSLLIRCKRWGVRTLRCPERNCSWGCGRGADCTGGFLFSLCLESSRLPVSGTAWSNNCIAKGDSSVGEGAVHPSWAVVIFPLMVMMILFFYSLSGKICDASCNLKMFWFTVTVKTQCENVILQNLVGNLEAGIKEVQSSDNVK